MKLQLTDHLTIKQKFSLNEEEISQLVLHDKNPKTFETFRKAKLHFDTISTFCALIGLVLDNGDGPWFDESERAFKMVFTIKSCEGRIGETIANSLPKNKGDIVEILKEVFAPKT